MASLTNYLKTVIPQRTLSRKERQAHSGWTPQGRAEPQGVEFNFSGNGVILLSSESHPTPCYFAQVISKAQFLICNYLTTEFRSLYVAVIYALHQIFWCWIILPRKVVSFPFLLSFVQSPAWWSNRLMPPARRWLWNGQTSPQPAAKSEVGEYDQKICLFLPGRLKSSHPVSPKKLRGRKSMGVDVRPACFRREKKVGWGGMEKVRRGTVRRTGCRKATDPQEESVGSQDKDH